MNKQFKVRQKKHPYLKNQKIDELAQLAYLTYAKRSLKNAAPGNVMPTWEDLFDNQKQAWREVILKITKEI